MNIDFEEILKELEFRLPTGIINLNEENQVTKLVDILRENGVGDANEIAQKARVYFNYVNEATKKPDIQSILNKTVKNTDTGNDIKVSSALSYADSKNPGQKGAYTAAVAMLKKSGASSKDITSLQSKSKSVEPKKAEPTKLSGAALKTSAEKGKGTPEQKKELDRISIVSGESRENFYKKGYHKAESDDDAGSAPGNAGSMLNENGSCDVCEWALENDNNNLEDAVKHLYENLKGGALLEAEDKTGIAGQKDRVPFISSKELAEFRKKTGKTFDKLHDGQLSRLMIAANGGLLKANDIKQGISNLGWKEEETTVNGFFGDKSGKQQQIDAIKNANKIYAPSGQEIPKEEAIKLAEQGGGGANPSDTAQFAYNEKTGNLMIKFTSDKDYFDAIVAQSSFAKEGTIKKAELDSMVATGKLKKDDAEKLKTIIDKETDKLNKIENELKTVVAEPARALTNMDSKKLYNTAVGLNKSESGKKRMAAIEKKYGKGADGIKVLLKAAQDNSESLSSGDRRVIDDLKSEYKLDYLVAKKIDDIRKKSVAVERKLLEQMDKIKINLDSGDKVGLGTYLDAKNFIEKFHMAGALGDKHGVFKYDGLFDVVCGKGKITNDIISKCIGTKNQDDFIKKFGSEKEEFQLSKEKQITGSVRIAYFLNEKKQKIRLGEKRQRSKTGATGRFNTVYKWDKDTINCFKDKNGIK
jgi:hypothetical protein